MSEPIVNPAEHLEGHVLEDGWVVGAKIQRPDQATGGRFSVCYEVTSAEGRIAFLKALNYSYAFEFPPPQINQVMAELLAAFKFEIELLDTCREGRLSRVVTAIKHGSIHFPESILIKYVEYLIFEKADGDIYDHLEDMKLFDMGWGLRSLHHIATGMMQLHELGIAHQDLKPSNVLVFNGNESKVADLGRGSRRDRSGPIDDNPKPCDSNHAPPEQQYHHSEPDWDRRRLGCDLYLLGSMAVSIITGINMTTHIFQHLPDEYKWTNWQGPYVEVLPIVRNAFGESLNVIRSQMPEYLCDRLCPLIAQLCDPDPTLRGDPKSRVSKHINSYRLMPFVSRFDSIAGRIEHGLFT